MSQPRVTLTQFIEQRLSAQSDPASLLRIMFERSFGAGTLRDFWRFWNPVYGYVLYYYCYRPLRRLLPRSLSTIATFAASGFFLHDLPFGWWVRALKAHSLPAPFVAIWFVLIALLVLLADYLTLSYARLPFAARAAINGMHIVVALVLAFAVLRFAR